MLKIFNPNKTKQIIRGQEIVNINNLEQSIKILSDIEIREEMLKLLLQAKKEVSLDNILEKSFALTREASWRTLGLKHFDTQLLGGLKLHKGKIVEMKTGEGKTLVATLPVCLNALSLRGVHVVTSNEYLAQRDQHWMSQLYRFLGLSVGLVNENMTPMERKKSYASDITYLTNSELAFDYLRDNMAVEPSELVQRPFNYCIIDEVDSILIDEARTPLIISGTSKTPVEKYVVADEIANYLEKTIHYKVDERNKNITLTSKGISQVQAFLNIQNLYDPRDPWIPYILNAIKVRVLFTIDSNYIIKNNEILIVDEFTGRIMEDRRWSDGLHQAVEAKENVPILEGSETLASITYQNFFLLYPKLSGMTGTAKTAEVELEKIYGLNVEVLPTTKPMVRKDFSDLVYKDELSKWKAVIKECVNVYSTGCPILIGTTDIEKSELIAQLLDERKLPYQLLNAKPENLKSEAKIIAQAGCSYNITVSTNMAGRGTDIMLGGNPDFKSRQRIINLLSKFTINDSSELYKTLFKDKNVKKIKNIEDLHDVKTLLKYISENGIAIKSIQMLKYWNRLTTEKTLINIIENGFIDKTDLIHNIVHDLYKYYYSIYKIECDNEKQKIIKSGGLYVIGTERHESQRIDNQLRGRAGRQGDPGRSRFFLSLDDDILRIFGGSNIKNLMNRFQLDNDTPLQGNFLSKSLNSAQEKVESQYYDTRKRLSDYDEIVNIQRKAIFNERKLILGFRSVRAELIFYGEDLIGSLVQELKLMTMKKNSPDKEFDKLNKEISYILNVPYVIVSFTQAKELKLKDLYRIFCNQFWLSYDIKEIEFEMYTPGLIRLLEKSLLLNQIDLAWKTHLEKIDILRDSIGWRSYGQLDPLTEYKNEAFNLFIETTREIKYNSVYNMLKSSFV